MASNSKKTVRRGTVIGVTDDVVLQGVLNVLNRNNDSVWTGTMTDLSLALHRIVSKKSKNMLPGSSSALRVVMNRVVNRLRSRGVSVRFNRTTDHMRTRFVKLITH